MWAINVLLMIAGSLIMWNVKRMTTDIKDLRMSHHEIRNHLTEIKVNYVHKDEFRLLEDKLDRRFDRLENLFMSRKHEGS